MDLKSIDPTVLATMIAVASSGVGAVTVALFGVLRDRSNRRSEERKIIYDIASKLAIEQWKLDVENTKTMNKEIAERGGVMNMPTGINEFRMPPPQVAQTVKRIIDEIYASTRPRSRWTSFQAWRIARKKKKAEQGAADQQPARLESKF